MIKVVLAGTVIPRIVENHKGRFVEGYAIENPDGMPYVNKRGRVMVYGGRLEVVRASFRLGFGYAPREIFLPLEVR